jgi:hypothetical protein
MAAGEKVKELGCVQQGMKRVINNISEMFQETGTNTVVCVARELSMVKAEEDDQELCVQSVVRDFIAKFLYITCLKYERFCAAQKYLFHLNY